VADGHSGQFTPVKTVIHTTLVGLKPSSATDLPGTTIDCTLFNPLISTDHCVLHFLLTQHGFNVLSCVLSSTYQLTGQVESDSQHSLQGSRLFLLPLAELPTIKQLNIVKYHVYNIHTDFTFKNSDMPTSEVPFSGFVNNYWIEYTQK